MNQSRRIVKLDEFKSKLDFEDRMFDDDLMQWNFAGNPEGELYGATPGATTRKFTERAKRNLCRAAGVPTSYIKTLEPSTLTRVFIEQMLSKDIGTFRMAANKNDEVVFCQKPDLQYNSLRDMLKATEHLGQPLMIKGDPEDSDVIDLMFNARKVDITDDNLTVGVCLTHYPTQLAGSKISTMLYRLICTNGLISEESAKPRTFKKNEFNTTDLAGILQYYVDASSSTFFADHVKLFREKRISPNELIAQGEVIKHHLLPSAVIKAEKYITAIAAPNMATQGLLQTMQAAGIPKVDNVWEGINVYTYVANEYPQPSSTQNIQKGIMKWALGYQPS